MLIKDDRYKSLLSVKETLEAIKFIKDFFEKELAKRLNLRRVSAPLFVLKSSGLNDDLDGVERPVSFDALNIKGEKIEVVQSLAKWKRMALGKYDFVEGEGLYTDMSAIRRDDEVDNTHSLYVDQWDWEMVIDKQERTIEKLEEVVKKVFDCLLVLEKAVLAKYATLEKLLPEQIMFINSQDLANAYPDLSVDERENEVCKKYGAVFIEKIGGKLKNGEKHGKRAPDYDDWELNGDILLWFPLLNKAVEISSMGIRVTKEVLEKQLRDVGLMQRADLPYHKQVLNGELPYTIGGGIGQSRLCMLFLNKMHIGEVQSSVWPSDMIAECKKYNIKLL